MDVTSDVFIDAEDPYQDVFEGAMVNTRSTISLLALLLIVVGTPGQTREHVQRDERRSAVMLWADAVAAKGGRARLAAIHSFAIREKTVYRKPTLPEMATGKDSQIVCKLPNGWWEFLDYRPGKMGYSVRVVDAKTGEGWAGHGGPATPLMRPDTFTPYRVRVLQAVYFLETQWIRPEPVRASRLLLGAKPVDRVETIVDGDSIVYYLDAATRLPVRVEATRRSLKPPRPGLSDEMTFVYDLASYHDVDGIQVPARVSAGAETAEVHLEINPEYDPSIFSMPPSPGSTIESWRKRPAK